MCDGGFRVVSSVVNARPARMGPTVCDDDGPIPMRNMSKTDSGCGASCAATSPETIAAGVGRDGSYVVTDAPRATGRRSMGTIVQQSHGGLPVGAVRQISGVAVPRLIFGVAVPRQISGRRVACPPARRPRCELRSARRLEARPGPAGPAAASNRAGLGALALALPPHSAWEYAESVGASG